MSQMLLMFNNLSPLYTLSAVTRTLHLQSPIRSANESDENPANYILYIYNYIIFMFMRLAC